MTWSVPLAHGGDGNFQLMLAKSTVHDGWFLRSDLLGAPDGQRLHDFPIADVLHMAGIKVISVLAPWLDYVEVFNLYYLLGFPAVAVTATYVLRRLDVSPLVAGGVGVIYAFSPYHFGRGMGHYFLATYYSVPLAILLVLGALGHTQLLEMRSEGPTWLRPLTPTTLVTVLSAVVVGTSSAYYATFCLVLLAVPLAVGALSRDRRTLRDAVLTLVLVGGAFMASIAPSLAFSRSNGANAAAVTRADGATEHFGLKLAHMLLPPAQHRIRSLGALARRYLEDFPIRSEDHAIGLTASAGVVALIGVVLWVCLRPSARVGRLARSLAALVLLAVFMATVGGFASVGELVTFPLLRGWNRLAIFISFLGLVAVARFLDRVVSARALTVRIVVVLAVVSAALIDQTSPDWRFTHEYFRDAWRADQQFVDAISASLGGRGDVFQLPATRFPESTPLERMVDYQHLRGYFHSDALRWSYGGVKGRVEGEWPVVATHLPMSTLLRCLRAAGFSGVWLDRLGYADDAQAVEAEVAALTDVSPVVHPAGIAAFYPLRPVEPATPRLGELLTNPVVIAWGPGFHGPETELARDARWAGPEASLILNNTLSTARRVELRFRLVAGTPSRSARTRVIASGGEPVTVESRGATDVSISVLVPPGFSTVRIVSDAARVNPANQRRALHFRVFDPHALDADLLSA